VTKKRPRASAPATRGIRIRWPRWYDWANRLNFLGRECLFREWTADLAAIAQGHSVLDVGCGTGNLTLAAKVRAGAAGEVIGIDAAPEMIGEAGRKAAEKGLEVRFEVGLIEDIPFPDRSFDRVLSSLMLHHLPRDLKRRGIAEVSRVLKPAGSFLAVDVDPPLIGNLRMVEEAMESHHFTGIERGRTGFRTMFIPIHFLRGTADRGGPECG
jgi:demethylmenaquinone methyltransferase/2-methoxy-6-polyprenyl-1,4-benzoquinol methylase/phosphoethanolamine N-methyltransferase